MKIVAEQRQTVLLVGSVEVVQSHDYACVMGEAGCEEQRVRVVSTEMKIDIEGQWWNR